MRAILGVLLTLWSAWVLAGTVTIQGPITLVICDGFKPVHYADNRLVITCPTGPFRLTITDCARPKLNTLSPGNYSLTCV